MNRQETAFGNGFKGLIALVVLDERPLRYPTVRSVRWRRNIDPARRQYLLEQSGIMACKSFVPLRCDLLRFGSGWSSTRLNGEQETGEQCDERLHGVHLKPAAVEG
jgi:hypothetical protein